VVGRNVTTRSDARIFSSDGNKTMKAFAQSSSFFRSTCAALFARMLDTVPRGVALTEVIEPLSVKPTSIKLVLLANGSFSLGGSVRVSADYYGPWWAQANHAQSSCGTWTRSQMRLFVSFGLTDLASHARAVTRRY
jgi:hypothetical protein